MNEQEFIKEIKRRFPESDIETLEDALNRIINTEYEHIFSSEIMELETKAMNKIKIITTNWSGRDLRQTFTYNTQRFRVITGLRNGRAVDAVKVLGNDGWKFLIGKDDIDTTSINGNISYVSNELSRKQYAKELGDLLKVAVVRLMED